MLLEFLVFYLYTATWANYNMLRTLLQERTTPSQVTSRNADVLEEKGDEVG